MERSDPQPSKLEALHGSIEQVPDQWLLAPCECVDDGDGDYGTNPSCPLHGGEA